MNPSQRITTFVVSIALALGAVGCVRAQPRRDVSHMQYASAAREVADRAALNDVNYFRGLIVDREKVPALIESVARSGIATNYAEHLEIESKTDATLVYRQDDGDVVLATPFTVRLSVNGGVSRVDQIIIGEYQGDVAERLGSFVARAKPSAMATEPLVSVAMAPGPFVAGSEQSVMICYANTLNTTARVPQPLTGQLIVIDAAGERVWAWGDFGASDLIGAVNLAPLESAYGTVTFTVPEPAFYILYARVNGTLSPAVRFEAIAK